MRRYRGYLADSSRWERFRLRDDDVIITTPSKCGTTWMQHIVGSLLLGRPELGAPISVLSPCLDMLTRTDEEVFALLDGQTGRRWIKTHTPLDGIPFHPSVTYIAVIRHPLDVALSDLDHRANQDFERVRALRLAAAGPPDASLDRGPMPEEPQAYLRWFIDNDLEGTGSGPYGVADYCAYVRTYWARRDEPNVHLFHYGDLWDDLDGEMRRVAAALGIAVDEARWPELVDGARLASMRARAADTAPEAHSSIWHDPQRFFRAGGTRGWASLLTPAELAHFHDRLRALAGDATDWVVHGRAALPSP